MGGRIDGPLSTKFAVNARGPSVKPCQITVTNRRLRLVKMRKNFRSVSRGAGKFAATLARQWAALCSTYLPLKPPGSIWRYSRAANPDDPDQGWKLHVSATILTANRTLQAVAPFLHERGTQFKAVASLDELSKLNSGIYYGYSQVGKFLTVYPNSNSEALFLAERLHELTREMAGPAAPFDEQFQRNSCIYYRYGSFKALEIENPNGSPTLAIRDPQGHLVPDEREALKPAWIPTLFSTTQVVTSENNPLKTSYYVLSALVQRGKGGVYKAIDVTADPPRFCVIKEGRQHGETNWDSRDGRWRVGNEERVLKALRKAGVEVPCIYNSFDLENNFYLVTEFVAGDTLQARLSRRRRRLSSAQVLKFAASLAKLLSRVHAAGWVWRDCKITNLIVDDEGCMRLLDFEGACRIAQPDPEPWGSPGYVPPDWRSGHVSQVPEAQDLYAMGAIIYLMLTGVLPSTSRPTPVQKLRPNVHPILVSTIGDLLNPDPHQRPSANAISRTLAQAFPERSAFNSTVRVQAGDRSPRNVRPNADCRKWVLSSCKGPKQNVPRKTPPTT